MVYTTHTRIKWLTYEDAMPKKPTLIRRLRLLRKGKVELTLRKDTWFWTWHMYWYERSWHFTFNIGRLCVSVKECGKC